MADESVTFDIKVVGLKDLKEAANTFERTGKVSRQLAAQFKPVGAATERVVNETRKLESTHRKLTKAIEDGIISRKQANNAMAEAVRRSKEAVLTDKNLIEIEKKKARAAEEARKREERLVRLYAPARAAARQYAAATLEIRNAHRSGAINAKEMEEALKGVKREFDEFTQGVATGGNQFAKFNLEAYKSAQTLKRQFNQGMQQAGYQVGDFIVQVQSGQSALVALGQQGSQLAGIFGPYGAVVGAVIAAGTAFAMIFQGMEEEGKTTVDSLKGVFGELPDFMEDVALALYTSFDVAFDKIEARYGVLVADFSRFRLEETKGTIAGSGEILLKNLQGGLRGFDPTKSELSMLSQARDFRRQFGERASPFVEPTDDMMYDALIQRREEENALLEQNKRITKDIVDVFQEQVNAAQSSNDIIEAQLQAYDSLKAISEDAAKIFYETYADSGLEDAVKKRADQEREAQEVAAKERLKLMEEYGLAAEEGARRQSTILAMQAGKEAEAREKALQEEGAAREYLAQRQAALLEENAKYEAEQNKARREDAEALFGYRAQAQAALLEENAKYEAEQEEARQKAAEAAVKAQEAQDRLNASSRLATSIQRIKNAALDAEVAAKQAAARGETNAAALQKAANEAAIRAAGKIAYLKEKAKGVTTGIAQAARRAAEEEERGRIALAGAAAEGRELDAALRSAASAMASISGLGTNLQRALAQAKAEAGAIANNLDRAAASQAAGLRFDILKNEREALATEGVDVGIVRAQTQYQLGLVDQLESQRQANAAAVKARSAASRKGGGGGGGGKDPAQAAAEYLEKLQREAEFKLQLVGLSEQEQRGMEIKKQYLETLEQDNRKLTETEQARIDAILKSEEALKKATEAEQRREAIQQTISSNIENALMSVVDGTQSVEDAFKSMLRNILLEIYRQMVAKPLATSITSFLGFANGGAFSGGNVVPFANGGVVGGPTFFPMSGGNTGLMGEAGPEAIMPLKRGSDGKLGVEGGGNVTVQQTFNFAANGDESVKRIIAEAAPKIANLTQKQILDSRRRGGTMKATFG